MITHREVLERNSTWNGESTALLVTETGETIDYAAFDKRVNRLANALRARGVRQSDRVVIALDNVTQFPISLYACYKLGAIPAPVNLLLAPDDFQYILDDLNPEAIIYGPVAGDDVELAVDRSVATPLLIHTEGGAPESQRYADLLADGDPSPPPEIIVEPDETSYILYTSGSTGEPKGVVFSARTAHHRRQETVMLTGVGPDTVALQLSPWFHAGGLENVIHPIVAVGGMITVTDDFSPENALGVIDNYDATHVVSVPTVSIEAANHEQVDKFDLSSLDSWLTMGSPLSRRAANTLMETLTPNIYNGYGTTETLIDACLRPVDLPEHAGTTGRPNVDKQVRIVEFDPSRDVRPDEKVDPGERGEVIVSGPTLVDSYYGNAVATNEALNDGWFYTKDIGIIDEDGYLTVTGRADDMILSGGELVSPVEVEETLEEHDAVDAAVVAGTSDEKWGERVTAYIVSAGVDESDLDKFCREHQGLADYKRAKEYHFIDEIERTETGKKQRFKYRK